MTPIINLILAVVFGLLVGFYHRRRRVALPIWYSLLFSSLFFSSMTLMQWAFHL